MKTSPNFYMVKKIHTRRLRYIPKGKERNRAGRFKTFLTEEAAKNHAEALGLKNYKIHKTSFGLGKKFKITLEK